MNKLTIADRINKKTGKPEEIEPEFAPVRRKLLRAFEVKDPLGVLTGGGHTRGGAVANVGDFVVQDETGELTVYSSEQFRLAFEFANAPAPSGFGSVKK